MAVASAHAIEGRPEVEASNRGPRLLEGSEEARHIEFHRRSRRIDGDAVDQHIARIRICEYNRPVSLVSVELEDGGNAGATASGARIKQIGQFLQIPNSRIRPYSSHSTATRSSASR